MDCVICGNPAQGKRQTCSKDCRYELVRRRHREAGTKPPTMTDEQREAARQRMTGPGCPKWNGGRTTGGSGHYLLVKPPPGFPYPEEIDNRGYVREHRLAMILHIGRALADSEVVHHINGDKLDNRLENLEIVSSQRDHMAGHVANGTADSRWPKCSEGCGRQAKPQRGHFYPACSKCRRTEVYRRSGKPGALTAGGKLYP